MEPVAPPVVVVNAGTAVTVDALDAEGVFRGGVILPGLRLMLQALAEHTAGLKMAPGTYQDFPTNTGDALYSGAMQAIAGAIGEMRARLASDAGPAKCLLAGGAAKEIAPHLGDGVEVVDSLVLEGVLALSDAP
jgi:type III pantothenate kinase